MLVYCLCDNLGQPQAPAFMLCVCVFVALQDARPLPWAGHVSGEQLHHGLLGDALGLAQGSVAGVAALDAPRGHGVRGDSHGGSKGRLAGAKI